MKIKPVFALICMVCLFVAGCTMPGAVPLAPPTAQQNPGVTISMDAPRNGAIYTVGVAAPLAAFVSSPSNGTIRSVDFMANGASIGTGARGDGYLYPTFSTTWAPQAAGEYYIQGQATLIDGSTALSEPVRVCVMSLTEAVPADWSGYLGQCQMPTRIPNPAMMGDAVINGVASPDEVCSPDAPITFVVHVTDPQDVVALVGVMLFRPDTPNNTALKAYLNWVTTRPGSQEEYRATIHLSPDFLEGSADNLVLYWRAFAFDRNGSPAGIFRGNSITVRYVCRPQLEIFPTETPMQQHLEVTASETPTPTAVLPPTFTFKKNAFCRKGPDMSFPDVTAVFSGEKVDILNISEDGFWYFIYWKKFDAKCWVAAGTGSPDGDTTGIQVLTGPTLPAPAVEPFQTDEPATPPAACNPLIRTCP
jgi:hypothetical protein